MPFPRVKPAGWVEPDPITAAHINQLDINVSKALNAVDGEVIAPTNPIEIGGAGLEVTGPFVVPAVTNRLDALEADTAALQALGKGAVYRITGSSVASGSKMTLDTLLTDTDQRYQDTGFSLLSNEITVPAIGRYLVCISLLASVSSAANPTYLIVRVLDTVSATPLIETSALRFNTTVGETLNATASKVVVVPNVARKIKVVNLSGSAITELGESYISITRIQ